MTYNGKPKTYSTDELMMGETDEQLIEVEPPTKTYLEVQAPASWSEGFEADEVDL